MHLFLLAAAAAAAWAWRQAMAPNADRPRSQAVRWRRALSGLWVPPGLVLAAAGAVLCMGHHGNMLGHRTSAFSCAIAAATLAAAGAALAFRASQTLRLVALVRREPAIALEYDASACGPGDRPAADGVATVRARPLDWDAPFAAQVGFWRSELVVSRGLLDAFAGDRLAAVLAHERAHECYRDPFWFFWLGWLRQISGWLPHTEALWEELLLLRELRADRRAAQEVDPLVLAEALVVAAQAAVTADDPAWVAFSEAPSSSRLAARVDALLSPPEPIESLGWPRGPWLAPVGLPFLSLLLHG